MVVTGLSPARDRLVSQRGDSNLGASFTGNPSNVPLVPVPIRATSEFREATCGIVRTALTDSVTCLRALRSNTISLPRNVALKEIDISESESAKRKRGLTRTIQNGVDVGPRDDLPMKNSTSSELSYPQS